ncbi:MAG TPA: biotin-dependent carboxyltransferase family protein [Candidatus Limnocylindrales bacterium]|nr:biotin-dependent carboxyltransferase family protein [Candidatus Limnocylindrales bacterium]
MLEVLATGPVATVQDLGRRGYQQLGVPRSGALDRAALTRANLLVGNDPSAAGLELSLGRFRALFHADAVLAVAGAPAPVTIAGRPVELEAPQPIHAGEELRVAVPTRGLHVYLAIAGGIEVAPVLGSRSTDTLSGIGPPPLRPGTRLPLGSARGPSTKPPRTMDPPAEIRVKFGPRDDWFTDPLALTRNPYRLSTSNRIGARLDGPALTRSIPGELPSEGLIPGAIQVPGDGRPIVFLADHPATGGYPVIAVVHPDDLAFVAQARPGASVVFRGP